MAELALRERQDEGVVGATEKNVFRRLLEMREIGILGAAAALFIVLSILEPDKFLTQTNIIGVAQRISLLTIIATGMTFVFIVGEIDLSVGSMYGLLAIGLSMTMVEYGWDPALALPAVIVAGAAIGFINGFITTFFGIPSFIVTLGMLAILRGVVLTWVKTPPFGRIGGWFDKIFGGKFLEVPAQVYWMLGIVMVTTWVLSRTKFGYHVYATGSNPLAAANAGIDVKRTKILCFMILGALTGFAAAIITGWLHGVSRSHGQGYELDVIAAVVIGGTNLFGGAGSVVGTLLGAAIIGMIGNGLIILGADIETEQIAKGLVIILAVLLDTYIRRRRRIA
ncbi:MAG: ABC transporter permease [Thermomicrobiales bacterium]|nr:ABC transporter permease [Thermomicrobiales bacterium]